MGSDAHAWLTEQVARTVLQWVQLYARQQNGFRGSAKERLTAHNSSDGSKRGWRNGRRSRLKNGRDDLPCGFESRSPHQRKNGCNVNRSTPNQSISVATCPVRRGWRYVLLPDITLTPTYPDPPTKSPEPDDSACNTATRPVSKLLTPVLTVNVPKSATDGDWRSELTRRAK